MTFVHRGLREEFHRRDTAWRRKRVRGFVPVVTSLELVLRRRLAREGFCFDAQAEIETDHSTFTVDILIKAWKDISCKPELVVEVRGGTHYTKDGRRRDARKTRKLVNTGHPVMWIENREVENNLDRVIENIKHVVVNGTTSLYLVG